MSSYIEPEKNKARSAVICSSIEALTKNRSASTLARRSYVRDVRDHILGKDNPYDALVAERLSDETIERWELFYDSIVQSRSPENLKVAYLSGPNPENDLKKGTEGLNFNPSVPFIPTGKLRSSKTPRLVSEHES